MELINLKKVDLSKGQPVHKEAPLESHSFFRWIRFLLKGHWLYFILTTLSTVIRRGIPSLKGLFVAQIIAGFAYDYTIMDMHASLFWFWVFVVINAINFSAIYLNTYNAHMMTLAKRQFSLLMLKHYFSLPLTWHEKASTGAQLQKILQARNSLHSFFAVYYYKILPTCGTFAATFVSLYATSLPSIYYLIFSLYISSYMLVTSYMSFRMGPKFSKLYGTVEDLMGRVYEFVSHIRLVKSISLEKELMKRAADYEKAGVDARYGVSISSGHLWFFNVNMALLWNSIIIFISMNAVIAGTMDVATFSMLVLLSGTLGSRLEGISDVFSDMVEQKTAIMRGVALLKEEPEHVDIRPYKKLPEKWNSIKFNNTSYHYDKEGDHALSNINVHIQRGEHIGLVGYSGSGKSTFVKLLMKHALPSDGVISLDDIPLKNIRREPYLETVALVPQEVELFNDTILENIALGRKLPEKSLKKVLKDSYVDEFIDKLPEGLQTVIGERGVKLSGGQKQRLGIARALARQGDIIVFDEATSALDSVSEHYIQQSIKSAFKKKTMVVIAHRLATIAHLDRILVFDKGQIIEQGTHQELLDKDGVYARMWRLQSHGFLADEK